MPQERTELSKQQITDALRQAAADAGFAHTGIAPAVTPTGYHRLLEWLSRGYAGEMQWMQRRKNAYESPEGVMPGTRSVVVAALNYNKVPPETGGARISRYARGRIDYHTVMRQRLRRLADAVHAQAPGARTRAVVDTAPLLERDFARLAGIGWFGKNTMLISRTIGSFFFLGALLTDLELEYDRPQENSWCGTCTRCLEACPTDAFPEPGVLDARRCISYLTIELRQAPIPRELRSGIGAWIFGCDICQDVCPWNRFAPDETVEELQPVAKFSAPDARRLLRMSEAEFRAQFAGTPLERPGYSGVRRNAAIVLGNAGNAEAFPDLAAALDDSDPCVRGAAAWAIGQLKSPAGRETLRRQRARETNAETREEIESALVVLEQGDPPECPPAGLP